MKSLLKKNSRKNIRKTSKKTSKNNKAPRRIPKKKESSELICGIGSTYDLIPKRKIKKKIKLQNIKKIKKIGTIDITGNVVIGDTDITVLDKMKKGVYDAYTIDDNLMIISKSNEKISKNDIEKWEWTFSGKGVGVDSGFFGFFDSEILNQINDLISKKNLKRLQNNKSVESLRYKMNLNSINRQRENIPYAEFPDLYNGFLSNTNLIKEDIILPNNLKNKNYGVMAPTETGDGGFECYIIGNNKAILIGGITQEKINKKKFI